MGTEKKVIVVDENGCKRAPLTPYPIVTGAGVEVEQLENGGREFALKNAVISESGELSDPASLVNKKIKDVGGKELDFEPCRYIPATYDSPPKVIDSLFNIEDLPTITEPTMLARFVLNKNDLNVSKCHNTAEFEIKMETRMRNGVGKIVPICKIIGGDVSRTEGLTFAKEDSAGVQTNAPNFSVKAQFDENDEITIEHWVFVLNTTGTGRTRVAVRLSGAYYSVPKITTV